MPIEAITPQSAAEQSVSVAAPVQNQSSAVDEQPSQSATSDTSGAGTSTESGKASSHLNPDDFESLEDYAQALIEKKQPTASRDRSAVGDEDEEPEATGSGEEEPLRAQHSAVNKNQEEQKETPGQADEEQ